MFFCMEGSLTGAGILALHKKSFDVSLSLLLQKTIEMNMSAELCYSFGVKKNPLETLEAIR